MKNYIVHYYIKANGTEFERTITLLATNAKEACSMCKIAVKVQTGRNAFRPVAKPSNSRNGPERGRSNKESEVI